MAKYCTRCNKAIFTAWRTLDDKKFYHPHCFTCAVCNTILECVQECGAPNLKEIYCKKCYNDCLRGEKISRWYENSGSGQGQGEELVQFRSQTSTIDPHFQDIPSYMQISVAQSQLPYEQPSFHQHQHHHQLQREQVEFRVPLGQQISSSSSISDLRENHHHHPCFNHYLQQEEILPAPVHHHLVQENIIPDQNPFEMYARRTPKPPSKQSRKSMNSDSVQPQSRKASMTSNKSSINDLQRGGFGGFGGAHRLDFPSRIPRPTTSRPLTKKSTILNFASSDMIKRAKTKSKLAINQLQCSASNKVVSSLSRASTHSNRSRPPGLPKMQRSISLVQPKSARSNNNNSGGGSSSKHHAIPKATKSFCQPRTSMTEEQQYTPPPRVPQAVMSKRQCAASFSIAPNSHPSDSKSHQSDSVFRKKSSDMYYQNETGYSHTKMELPTPQAILSVVRKERIDLKTPTTSIPSPYKMDENANFINKTPNPKAVINLPRRNYSITFDCPICISSLVPGQSNGASGSTTRGARGNVVTLCGHLFHRDCMENWLRMKGNKRCPICSALCLPETLQPVYLECNVSAEIGNTRNGSNGTPKESGNYNQGRLVSNKSVESAYSALRYEHEQLKRKYNAMVQEKQTKSLSATMANSLQSAYEMECRNRLQLQWENKKLQQQVQELLLEKCKANELYSQKASENLK